MSLSLKDLPVQASVRLKEFRKQSKDRMGKSATTRLTPFVNLCSSKLIHAFLRFDCFMIKLNLSRNRVLINSVHESRLHFIFE